MKFSDRDEIATEFTLPIREKVVNSHLTVNTSGVSVTRILALKFWIRPTSLNPTTINDQLYMPERENEDEIDQLEVY